MSARLLAAAECPDGRCALDKYGGERSACDAFATFGCYAPWADAPPPGPHSTVRLRVEGGGSGSEPKCLGGAPSTLTVALGDCGGGDALWSERTCSTADGDRRCLSLLTGSDSSGHGGEVTGEALCLHVDVHEKEPVCRRMGVAAPCCDAALVHKPGSVHLKACEHGAAFAYGNGTIANNNCASDMPSTCLGWEMNIVNCTGEQGVRWVRDVVNRSSPVWRPGGGDLQLLQLS